jgi:hypothetical protein
MGRLRVLAPTWCGLAAGAIIVAAAAQQGAAQVVPADEAGPTPTPTWTIVGVSPPAPGADGRLRYDMDATGEAVTVDGHLDEPGWAGALVVPLPWEVSPGDNGVAPVSTECRLTYDESNLYVGCMAEDPDPERIRAYVVDRDGIDGHDRITLTLDPFNDQRRAFQFGVSALGVQSDGVMSQNGSGGPNGGQGGVPIDASWDAIWSSAGRITENGFVVEAAIPFQSLRFPRDSGGRAWGVYLTRWWPRSANTELRSARWDRDDSCVLCQANLVTGIRGGTPGTNVQLTPTFTSARHEGRTGPDAPLVGEPITRDVGLDAQWGITSDLTLNLTANPDFSQVEADAAQLDVNNRFALFFPEKRPFFLEGADFFGTPIQAVFTRSIVDPTAGAKVTGKLGASAVGVLVAQDRTNSLLIPGSQFSRATALDDPVVTAVGRFRRDVGSTSTIGALYTGREGTGYFNRVGGVDAFYRPLASVTLQAQLLQSSTRYPDEVVDDFAQPSGSFDGRAFRLRGQWSTREWQIGGDVRQTDPGFRADAGFVTQAGVRGGNVFLTRRWWGATDRWFTQLRLEGGSWLNRDYDGNQLNGGLWFGLGYDGPGQLSIGVWPNLFMKEHFAGRAYEDMSQLWFDVRAAPSGRWSVGLNGNVGDAIDFANERLGNELRLAPSTAVRIGRRTEVEVSHTYQRMDQGTDRVFTANLTQLRTIYNFSTRSFVRAVVQYRRTDRNVDAWMATVDRRDEGLFAQLLYAYKLNPQTVLFLGYSQDGAGVTDFEHRRTPVTVLGRTLFLKLGYAWRP